MIFSNLASTENRNPIAKRNQVPQINFSFHFSHPPLTLIRICGVYGYKSARSLEDAGDEICQAGGAFMVYPRPLL